MEQSNLTISIIEKRLFYLNSESLLLNNLSTLVHHSTHLWNNALDMFCFHLPRIDALPSETFLSHLSPSDNPDFDHGSGGGGGCARPCLAKKYVLFYFTGLDYPMTFNPGLSLEFLGR